MGLATKQQILSRRTLKLEKVPTPEWDTPDNPGSFVYVMELKASVKDMFEVRISAKAEGLPDGPAQAAARMDNFTAELCAATICDENYQPLFSPADVPALGDQGCGPVKRIYRTALRLNGMDDEVARMEKNSETAPGTSSPTG